MELGGDMSGTVYTLYFQDRRPINELVKEIFTKRPEFPDRTDLFELSSEGAAVFGAGDGYDIRLTFMFNNVSDQDLLEIEAILELAKSFDAEICVEVEESASDDFLSE